MNTKNLLLAVGMYYYTETARYFNSYTHILLMDRINLLILNLINICKMLIYIVCKITNNSTIIHTSMMSYN